MDDEVRELKMELVEMKHEHANKVEDLNSKIQILENEKRDQ